MQAIVDVVRSLILLLNSTTCQDPSWTQQKLSPRKGSGKVKMSSMSLTMSATMLTGPVAMLASTTINRRHSRVVLSVPQQGGLRKNTVVLMQ